MGLSTKIRFLIDGDLIAVNLRSSEDDVCGDDCDRFREGKYCERLGTDGGVRGAGIGDSVTTRVLLLEERRRDRFSDVSGAEVALDLEVDLR